MLKSLLAFVISLFSIAIYATHNQAGDITYRHISGLTYEITVTIFADNSLGGGRNAIARKDIEIDWGDNTGRDSIIVRQETAVTGKPNILKRVWIALHTYPGSGSYILRVEDPNRNDGVNNINNSVNVPFTIETDLRVLPFQNQTNSSVILLNDPLDDACTGAIFTYNPGAFDPDGDSIAYEIAKSKGLNGQIAPGYEFPSASNSITVDALTGDLIWDTPDEGGIFNVAILIKEYRKGVLVGSVLRDIQIRVIPGCDNQPPDIVAQQLVCVEADSTASIPIVGTDPDLSDDVRLTITGEFFEAGFLNPPSINDFNQFDKPVTASFTWNTVCSNVRISPYVASIKAEDNADQRGTIVLTTFKNINIRVVAPAPEDVTAVPSSTSIQLSWLNNRCQSAAGYYVYRRLDSSGYVPKDCEIGVPNGIGYERIAIVEGQQNISFLDDNNGEGLIPGQRYCYLVTKYFTDGDESYASDEVCSEVPKIVPVITKVSVFDTDETNGSISLAWSNPDTIDEQVFPPPYRYLIYEKLPDNNFQLIDSTLSLSDTTDSILGINTRSIEHRYQIRLFSYGNGKVLVGSTAVASSVFLSIVPTDELLQLSWTVAVPWVNDSFVVYRRLPNAIVFDSIATVKGFSYNDSNLINGDEYCYYIQSYGKYNLSSVISPLINLSQINCGIPIDNVSPCPPLVNVIGDCKKEEATISWTSPTDGCASDVASYRIYRSRTTDSELVLLDSITTDTVYELTNESISGCYAISSIDSTGNESVLSGRKCLEFCPEYELPNVFTPNGDGINDFFVPIKPYRDVDSIDIIIFNRWGEEVFRTSNPDILWNGDHQNIKTDIVKDATNNPSNKVSSGVYFYVCKVFELSLDNDEPRILKGSITLLEPKTEEGN